MKTALHALVLGTALGSGALALSALAQTGADPLQGTVTDVFDNRFVLETAQGRFLVGLPDSGTMPRAGTRVAVAGDVAGTDVAATAVTEIVGLSDDSATTDPAADADLPAALRGIGLGDLRILRDDEDTEYWGRLPDGTRIMAEYDRDDLEELRIEQGAPVPTGLLSAVLPESITGHPRMADYTGIHEIEFDSDDFEIKGVTGDGMELELEFSLSGDLVEANMKRPDAPRGIGVEAARAALSDMGYTDIGWLRERGHRIEAQALNPDGERVSVRLDRDGRIDRERALRH